MDTIKMTQLTNIYAYSDSFCISIEIFKFQTFIVGKNKMLFFYFNIKINDYWNIISLYNKLIFFLI